MMSGLNASAGPPKRVVIFEQSFGGPEIGVLQQSLVPPMLQIDVIIIRHSVIAVDLEALGKQQGGQMKSDKACRTRNQNPARGRSGSFRSVVMVVVQY